LLLVPLVWSSRYKSVSLLLPSAPSPEVTY
jgi:hypothetical protein